MELKKRIKLAMVLGVVLFIVLIIIDYFQYNELNLIDNFLQSTVSMFIIASLSWVFRTKEKQ